MTFNVRIARRAQRDIAALADYLSTFSDELALEHSTRLARVIAIHLAQSPFTWPYFPFTGAPYRGYLFRVGRRTQYWIVYTVDEDNRTVDILRFWNAMRDPETLDL
jgi:plasmid stabilization system protein ParE